MSEAEGAQTSIHLATAAELKRVTGRYFDRLREVPSSKASRDEEASRRLWDVSQRLVDAVLR
jgi:hypothetical protein